MFVVAFTLTNILSLTEAMEDRDVALASECRLTVSFGFSEEIVKGGGLGFFDSLTTVAAPFSGGHFFSSTKSTSGL